MNYDLLSYLSPNNVGEFNPILSDISSRLLDVIDRIRRAEAMYQRKSGSVSLIAVSKTRPVEDIAVCYALGQLSFGENYLNDASPKVAALADKNIEWHFIGHIQSNKCQEIAQQFDWVHSIDRAKIARRLNDWRPPEKGILHVFLQVKLHDEASKSGVAPAQLADLAGEIGGLEKLKLRGLMAIPAPEPNESKQRRVFAKLRKCQEDLQRQGFELDCLSMGMTDDMEAAIAEGATHVRIGTAIFGPRPVNTKSAKTRPPKT